MADDIKKGMLHDWEKIRQLILIVDDSELNRDLLSGMLKDDFRILEAANGKECLEALEQYGTGISLVLLDINMPVLNGFEVLVQMNRNHLIEDIPVIMISSEESDACIRRAFQLGVADYISRPFDNHVVRQRVFNTIKLYAKQRRLTALVSEQIHEKEKNNQMMVEVLSQIVEFRNGASGLHVLHLKEMQEMGTVRTRITIEDFVASLTAEYYNYVQQTLRLQNFRYAVALSRERLRITEARVYAADQLFATLDPTLRRIDVADVGETVLADTVGFIRHLPHDLVAAFKATLQETRQATLLLHVIDAADVRVQENIEAVNTVLEEIDAHEIPTLLVMNKIDMLEDFEPRIDRDEENKPIRVWLSAQTGAGIPQLFQALTERLSGEVAQHTLRLPPQEGRLRSRFYQLQAIEKEWMEEDGSVSLQVRMPIVDWRRLCKQEPALIDYLI